MSTEHGGNNTLAVKTRPWIRYSAVLYLVLAIVMKTSA